MTVVAYAELTYPATGYVQMYESDKETAHTPVEGDLVWTIDKEGEEVVLTITGEAPTLTFNSKAAWNNWSGATVPWFNYLNAVTKVVIEAPITAIEQDCAFNKLANAHTVVLPETEIRLKGSMIFAGMKALKTLGPEGTEEYTLDLRTLYGGAAQPFDTTCLNVGDNTITVLMPYTLSCPMNTVKPFNNETKVLFKVLAGSSSDITVSTIKAHADDWDNYTTSNKNVTPHTKYVTVEYYDASDLGVISGGVEGKYQYNFDFATGALTILNKYPSGWRQFDTHGPEWQAFTAAWGQYVKTAVVDKFDKISFGQGGKTPLFAGMANLETVKFQSGQRMQNGKAAYLGWFEGCTSLKSISFGGELVDGVFDFSGMTFHKDDSYTSYLSNIFKGCESVKEVILPANEFLVSVKATTFAGCTSLEKVTLLSSITEIEDGAFADCPNVVLVVEEGSFAHTWAEANDVAFEIYTIEEESKYIEGRFSTNNEFTYSFNKETKVLTIAGTGNVLEMDYVMNCEGIVRKDTNGDGISEIVAYLPWLQYGFAADVKEVVIEAEITSIGDYMLSKLTNCAKITVPASLTEIRRGGLAYIKALNAFVVEGNEAVEGEFDFTNIKFFGEYVFDDALDNVTPVINFSSELVTFGVAKMAQKCKQLTFNFDGAENAAAGFILKLEKGEYEGNSNICQEITVNYNKDFNPFCFEGYSVRLTDYNGLRSVFSVSDSSLALYTYVNGVTVKEYGTLVGTLDNFENNPESEKIIKTVICADGEYVGKLLAEPNEKANFAVTLVNIPEEHYETVFASLVYVVLVDEEGEETVEYFCQNSAAIKTVATAMYEAGAFDEETGPVAMEIVNYGKEATETPVAYAEKSYFGI